MLDLLPAPARRGLHGPDCDRAATQRPQAAAQQGRPTEKGTPVIATWHAHMDTQWFAFDAYGASEQDALSSLRRGFQRHLKNAGVSGAHVTNNYLRDTYGACVIQVKPGQCWVDHDREV